MNKEISKKQKNEFDVIISNNYDVKLKKQLLKTKKEQELFDEYALFEIGLSKDVFVIQSPVIKVNKRKTRIKKYACKSFYCGFNPVNNNSIIDRLAELYGPYKKYFNFSVDMSKTITYNKKSYILIEENGTLKLEIDKTIKVSWTIDKIIKKSGLKKAAIKKALKNKKFIVKFQLRKDKTNNKVKNYGTLFYILN